MSTADPFTGAFERREDEVRKAGFVDGLRESRRIAREARGRRELSERGLEALEREIDRVAIRHDTSWR
jgi:hypothetical protein